MLIKEQKEDIVIYVDQFTYDSLLIYFLKR